LRVFAGEDAVPESALGEVLVVSPAHEPQVLCRRHTAARYRLDVIELQAPA
jgi:hypothetical protein